MKTIVHGDCIAFYISVDDKTLDDIINNKKQLLDIERVKELSLLDGDNIHFLGLKGCIEARVLIRYIKELRKKFKTVTWFNKDFSKIRGELCHS